MMGLMLLKEETRFLTFLTPMHDGKACEPTAEAAVTSQHADPHQEPRRRLPLGNPGLQNCEQ